MMLSDDRRFSLYTLCLIFLFTLILAMRWRWMPTFIDIYYHLLTVLNFDKAGGFSAVSLWEYAPFGRVHLYPPLLHILMLIVFKLTRNILIVGRVFELASFPLVLAAIFIAIRRMFSPRLAFWSVLVAACAYSFYLSCVDFLAATLAFCLGLMVFYCLEREKIICALIFLALCLYSHTSMSLFFVLALVFYALFKREKLKPVLVMIAAALIVALPLFIYQLKNLGFVDLSRVTENFPFEINLIAYLLAGFGAYIAVRQRRKYAFFLALVLATLPFLFLRYRFLSGQGMIGIIFLAALSLDYIYEKFISAALARRQFKAALVYLLLIFLGVFLMSPSVTVKGQRARLNLFGSTYINIFPTQEVRERTNEISIYMPKSFAPVFDIVAKETGPDELITSNFEYLAGFIATFTDRATTSAMLTEVKPYREVNPFSYAKLIIWLKDPQRLSFQPQVLINSLGLKKVAETELFFIYKNPKVAIQRADRPADVPFIFCVLILFFLLVAAFFDVARAGN